MIDLRRALGFILNIRGDIVLAASLLTRLPIGEVRPERSAKAVWAYPLIGFFLGMFAFLVFIFLTLLGVPAGPTAAVVLIALVMMTGGLHEDGLADSADGLFAGGTKERMLEIMRDSRIGAFGTIALVCIFLVRWSTLSLLLEAHFIEAVIFACVASRAVMSGAMALLPPARKDGLYALTGQAPLANAALSFALATAMGLYMLGWFALVALLAAVIAAAFLLDASRRRLGGQTGDILGATQQISEVVVLIAASAILA